MDRASLKASSSPRNPPDDLLNLKVRFPVMYINLFSLINKRIDWISSVLGLGDSWRMENLQLKSRTNCRRRCQRVSGLKAVHINDLIRRAQWFWKWLLSFCLQWPVCAHKVQRPSCTSQKKGVAGTVYRAGGGLGVGGGGGGGNVSHTQSTVKCPFNHSQKPPWFICAAAQIYISKHPSY